MPDVPNWQNTPRKPPWVPPYYHSTDVAALKACWAGEATPGQQRMALEWIIMHGAEYGELSYRSDSSHDTAFAQGRLFVGQQVQKLIGLDGRLVEKLRENENAGKREQHRTASNTTSSGDRTPGSASRIDKVGS